MYTGSASSNCTASGACAAKAAFDLGSDASNIYHIVLTYEP